MDKNVRICRNDINELKIEQNVEIKRLLVGTVPKVGKLSFREKLQRFKYMPRSDGPSKLAQAKSPTPTYSNTSPSTPLAQNTNISDGKRLLVETVPAENGTFKENMKFFKNLTAQNIKAELDPGNSRKTGNVRKLLVSTDQSIVRWLTPGKVTGNNEQKTPRCRIATPGKKNSSKTSVNVTPGRKGNPTRKKIGTPTRRNGSHAKGGLQKKKENLKNTGCLVQYFEKFQKGEKTKTTDGDTETGKLVCFDSTNIYSAGTLVPNQWQSRGLIGREFGPMGRQACGQMGSCDRGAGLEGGGQSLGNTVRCRQQHPEADLSVE